VVLSELGEIAVVLHGARAKFDVVAAGDVHHCGGCESFGTMTERRR
jgi:hypothetical protein